MEPQLKRPSLPDLKLLDDGLMESIAKGESPGNYLILEEHPDFKGQWLVQCLDAGFMLDFHDLIGSYRAVSPAKLELFLKRAHELGYEVAFGVDPTGILSIYERLNDKPTVELASPLPGTKGGFLPYQLQGFNFLKDLHGGVAMWSTGTGKTVLAGALLGHHLQLQNFDFAWVVVKAHNKTNTQRTLKRLADIDSVVLDGPQKRRHETLSGLLEAPPGTVIITNYEKFRVDLVHMLPLFEKRVLIIWDEMPTKLKSRETKLYRAIRKLLYKKANMSELRPKSLRQYMLSATPIENNPEDWYNCVRLLDPSLYGTVKNFRDEFVASYDIFNYKPQRWHHLDRMGLKAAHIVHQVDKESPDIAAQFPSVIEEPYYIDWSKEDRAIYELLAAEVKRNLVDREHFEDGLFGLIAVMQMMCCAPSMVSNSAGLREAYEMGWGRKGGSEVAYKLQKLLTRKLRDDNHTKLQTLRQLICEEHPNEKVVVFTAFNNALHPILETHFQNWAVPYVRYAGTAASKQTAQDYFQNEDFVRVFLSSDAGSDSISLEEASVIIHYDLPWKYSTYTQRQNRIHRVVSAHSKVRFYTLMMADSVEERKMEVIMKKKGYQDGIFKGVISEQSESARMSREDLMYILGA